MVVEAVVTPVNGVRENWLVHFNGMGNRQIDYTESLLVVQENTKRKCTKIFIVAFTSNQLTITS